MPPVAVRKTVEDDRLPDARPELGGQVEAHTRARVRRPAVERDRGADEQRVAVPVHAVDERLVEAAAAEAVLIPRLGLEGRLVLEVLAQHALEPEDERTVADIATAVVREVEELHPRTRLLRIASASSRSSGSSTSSESPASIAYGRRSPP